MLVSKKAFHGGLDLTAKQMVAVIFNFEFA